MARSLNHRRLLSLSLQRKTTGNRPSVVHGASSEAWWAGDTVLDASLSQPHEWWPEVISLLHRELMGHMKLFGNRGPSSNTGDWFLRYRYGRGKLGSPWAAEMWAVRVAKSQGCSCVSSVRHFSQNTDDATRRRLQETGERCGR